MLSIGCARTVAPAGHATTSPRENPAVGAQAFVNGQWLRDDHFVSRTMYAVRGVLQSTRPLHVDSVIDLHGGWVIPPFGDAHNHMLASRRTIDPFREQYLHEGTFYVQVPGNRWTTTSDIRDQFNRPCALDVTWANGFLTATLGHGFETGESKAMGIFDLQTALRTREGDLKNSRIAENDAYWFIDSLPDLERKWPLILAQHPDLIKITLVFSSDSAERAPNGPSQWYAHGLRPQVVPAIVKRAHAVGLRVAAHVDSGHDIEVAVRTGVDILAHNAGYGVPENGEDDFKISDEVARMAGQHHTIMIPTAAIEADFRDSTDAAGLVRDLEVQRFNLRLLAKYGVSFAVGPDMYGATARAEVDALRRLGVWSDAQLLRIWFESTPRSIFPRRRIGQLTDGYEASFLVLDANPVLDFHAVDRIRLRVKQGCVVT